MCMDILEGLAQLHAVHILHLDLKPGNVLLDQDGHAYLADFGISHALTTLEDCTAITSAAGTPHYLYVPSKPLMCYCHVPLECPCTFCTSLYVLLACIGHARLHNPFSVASTVHNLTLVVIRICFANLFLCAGRAPEQADADRGPRGTHTDVWGFASCVLHLATGRLPYRGLTHNQTLTALVKSRAPEVPSSLPAWLQQALKQCLSFDPAARPTVAHLRQVGAVSVPS